MKKILLSNILLSATLFAHSTQTEINTYIESLNFKNSVQKSDGKVVGVGSNIKIEKSLYQFTYEHAKTNTKQPPLNKDLKIDKLALKYSYEINNNWKVNLNYLNILSDNIAETSHGKAYGGGITYNFTQESSLNLTQFFIDYKHFNIHQTDIKFDQKIKINELKAKISIISKNIHLSDRDNQGFSVKAKEDYSIIGLKVHSHLKSYHLGFGAYYGKRAFAIMQDGFKIQHHAMEFDRTYAAGFGKTFNKLTLRLQYTYQRAIEIPLQNGKNVDVANTRVLVNYKF